MADDQITKAMKVVSTISLGYLAGITAFKISSIQPSLEEQDDVPAACKTMCSILKRSSVLPLASIISSASTMVVFYRTYSTPSEDKFYLVSPILMFGLVPYTSIFLLPINKQFLEPGETFEGNDQRWKGLLMDWKKWHFPRSIVCASLFSIVVYKLVF